MKTLLQTQQQLAAGEFEFSPSPLPSGGGAEHQRAGNPRSRSKGRGDRELSRRQVFAERVVAGLHGGGRPLHLQVSFAESDVTKIITIYEPDPNEWIENRKRR